ncbi:MAG: ErpK protein [Butyrivibrio sp.]|nr:ErpK protein [Butyrivibrio sp.]
MAGRKVSLDDKIKKQEELVFKAKEKYDSEVEKQNRLLTKRRELESKELVKAFEKSGKSLQEILDFMTGSPMDDD